MSTNSKKVFSFFFLLKFLSKKRSPSKTVILNSGDYDEERRHQKKKTVTVLNENKHKFSQVSPSVICNKHIFLQYHHLLSKSSIILLSPGELDGGSFGMGMAGGEFPGNAGRADTSGIL